MYIVVSAKVPKAKTSTFVYPNELSIIAQSEKSWFFSGKPLLILLNSRVNIPRMLLFELFSVCVGSPFLTQADHLCPFALFINSCRLLILKKTTFQTLKTQFFKTVVKILFASEKMFLYKRKIMMYVFGFKETVVRWPVYIHIYFCQNGYCVFKRNSCNSP